MAYGINESSCHPLTRTVTNKRVVRYAGESLLCDWSQLHPSNQLCYKVVWSCYIYKYSYHRIQCDKTQNFVHGEALIEVQHKIYQF